MTLVITRQVSPTIGQCELTHLDRQPIDVAKAQRQHRAYEQCLLETGCRLISLPAEPDLPDAVFVEDTAVILDEIAVLTRPGAASRRQETASITRALKPYRPLVPIKAPGCLDGGDVLQIGKTIFVGLSGRSNESAINQLQQIVSPFGYAVTGVPVNGCLHLKSALSQVAENTLLINRRWVDADFFNGYRLIDIDPAEPYAANGLRINDTLIYPDAFARTCQRLVDRHVPVRTVDLSELAKAEGAVTCCSLIIPEA